MSPGNVVWPPGTGNLHDVPDVWPINMPRPQYVSDGGQTGSNVQKVKVS